MGQEITAIAGGITDKRILTDPRAWDELIEYARGKHFTKFYDYKSGKSRSSAAAQARETEIAAAGATFVPTETVRAPRADVVIDDYTKEIARNLNMTVEEYIHWSKV